MLTKRIIPCLDVKDGRVVKGINFINLIDAGDPVECAKAYSDLNADELVFLDITASSDDRSAIVDVIEKVAKNVFIPLTVGGGIRTVDDMRKILMAGADKISINSAAVKDPDLINKGAEIFGNQCIVVAIDAKQELSTVGATHCEHIERRGEHCEPANVGATHCEPANVGATHCEPVYKVYVKGGRVRTDIDVIEWAKEVEKRGAGEILLTSMDKDGTKSGFDIELTKRVQEAVNIPIIASGGAGKTTDFKDILEYSDAALAASLFHFNEININDLKSYLQKEGVPVRKI